MDDKHLKTHIENILANAKALTDALTDKKNPPTADDVAAAVAELESNNRKSEASYQSRKAGGQ